MYARATPCYGGYKTDVVRNHWGTAKPTENSALEDCGVGCRALVRGNAF